MCDPLSLSSAVMDVGAGFAEGITAKANANFEAAQMEIMGIQAQAQGSSAIADLTRDYAQHFSRNIAAAAVSGLAQESFAAVRKGNKADMNRNIERIKAGVDRKVNQMDFQAEMRRVQGRMEASAAKWAGVMRGMNTIYDAETAYQRNRTANDDGSYQTRADYFFKAAPSLQRGISFFRRG